LTPHQVGPGSNDADETGVTGDEQSLVAASTAVSRCACLRAWNTKTAND